MSLDISNFYQSFIEIANIVKVQEKNINIIANDILIKNMLNYSQIVGYISQECEQFIQTKEFFSSLNNYIMAFNPIDGLDNFKSNITVGTIYALYHYDPETDNIISIVESGYCLYGSKTLLVKTRNNLVEQFYLNDTNNFIKQKNLSFEDNKERLYAINQSNRYCSEIDALILNYRINKYNQRWIGCMVADCHQILTRGGIFLYPSSERRPEGKLKLLYQILPMANIFKSAGGIGLDASYKDILDNTYNFKVMEKDIHKSMSIIFCSNEEHRRLVDFFNIAESIYC